MTKAFLLALAIATLPMSVSANSPQPVQQNNSNAVWFENWVGLSNTTMTIAQPDGEILTIYAATGTPVFQLPRGEVVDGIYRYELTAAREERIAIKNKMNDGRGTRSRDTVAVSFNQSGVFHVQRGVIVAPEIVEEE